MPRQTEELHVNKIKKHCCNEGGGEGRALGLEELGWGIFICIGVSGTLNYVRLVPKTYNYYTGRRFGW